MHLVDGIVTRRRWHRRPVISIIETAVDYSCGPLKEGGLSFCAQRHAPLKADEQFDAEIVANNSAIYLIVTSGRMASTNTCLCANFSQNEDAVEVDVSNSFCPKKKRKFVSVFVAAS